MKGEREKIILVPGVDDLTKIRWEMRKKNMVLVDLELDSNYACEVEKIYFCPACDVHRPPSSTLVPESTCRCGSQMTLKDEIKCNNVAYFQYLDGKSDIREIK